MDAGGGSPSLSLPLVTELTRQRRLAHAAARFKGPAASRDSAGGIKSSVRLLAATVVVEPGLANEPRRGGPNNTSQHSTMESSLKHTEK